MSSLDFIRHLVAKPALSERIASIAALRAVLATQAQRTDTVERAVLCGLAADGVGWAFAAGYQSALAKLDPVSSAGGRLVSLSATEEGGGHPRAIQTTLTRREGGWAVSGRKTFVTLGADADVLLVVAKAGSDASGRSVLRVVRIPSSRPGVSLTALPALPFAPEIGHASATLDAVEVGDDEVLEGDGYERVLKPFRTIEDVHVMAALLGWGMGVARTSGRERAWIEEAAAQVVLLRAVNAAPPLDAETHIALAGAMAAAKRLLDTAPWASAAPATREGWERDRPLLEVASSVRAARREAAWRTFETT